MKTKLKIILFGSLLILSFGCFEDYDDNVVESTSIKDFVWKAMNAVYLYKSDVDDLSDLRFETNQEYQTFLESHDSTENLFESLIYDRQNIDRFSIITDNYFELEQQLSGVSRSNGAKFNFYLVPGSSNSVFGIVRLILPNSNASQTNLIRGVVFNKINGTSLTISNLSTLLNNDNYSISLATYDDNESDTIVDDQIIDSDQIVNLTKEDYIENPIYNYKIINQNDDKIGYLMYNSFIVEYDYELNQVFNTFLLENIDHLVVDLRYNSGGSIRTATALASMITGQFNNQIFTTLKYNESLQSNNQDFFFTNNLNNSSVINSLNLNKVYILTSNRSASASEMIINSLRSYIDVTQIGDQTVGKSQASQIIYDSQNLSRNNVNSSHTYALLPLIAITVNKNDETVPPNGITPNISIIEKPSEYGIIGDSEEPLLKAALLDIEGSSRFYNQIDNNIYPLQYSLSNKLENIMYVNNRKK